MLIHDKVILQVILIFKNVKKVTSILNTKHQRKCIKLFSAQGESGASISSSEESFDSVTLYKKLQLHRKRIPLTIKWNDRKQLRIPRAKPNFPRSKSKGITTNSMGSLRFKNIKLTYWAKESLKWWSGRGILRLLNEYLGLSWVGNGNTKVIQYSTFGSK